MKFLWTDAKHLWKTNIQNEMHEKLQAFFLIYIWKEVVCTIVHPWTHVAKS